MLRGITYMSFPDSPSADDGYDQYRNVPARICYHQSGIRGPSNEPFPMS